MITAKTLKLSVKSLQGIRQKAAAGPGTDRAGRARRMPARDRAAHVQPGQAGDSAPVYPRGVRRFRRRRVRRVLCLRGDGADRPGRCHGRAGDVSRQRPDHRRAPRPSRRRSGCRASPKRACCSPTAPPSPTPAATWARCKPRRTGWWKTAGSWAIASTAASSGSATAASRMPTRCWRTRPAGPSWFIVERGAPGFTPGQARRQARHPHQQHGGALVQPTSTWMPDRLVGGVEGQGLLQAQAVFGYTRLMVAAFGLGAGWAALDRAIPYSAKRIQAGVAAFREAGIHAQADRAERRRAWRPAALTSRRPPSGSTPAKAA